MMKEVTVQEFVNAVKDVNIYDFEVMTGMKIDMSKLVKIRHLLKRHMDILITHSRKHFEKR